MFNSFIFFKNQFGHLHTDSFVAVQALLQEDRGRDANYHIINECRGLMQAMSSSRIEYAPRAIEALKQVS